MQDRCGRFLVHTQCHCNRQRHRVFIQWRCARRRREIHQPDAAWKMLKLLSCELRGETCLAAAANADQGQQAGVLEELSTLREHVRPPDEAVAGRGQIVWACRWLN